MQSRVDTIPKPIKPTDEPFITPLEQEMAQRKRLPALLVPIIRESFVAYAPPGFPIPDEDEIAKIVFRIKAPDYFRKCWVWYNTIYIASGCLRLFPYSVNEAQGPHYHPAIDLWRPYSVGTLAHECMHVFQYRRVGWFRWTNEYIKAAGLTAWRWITREGPAYSHKHIPFEIEATEFGYHVMDYWRVPSNLLRLQTKLATVYPRQLTRRSHFG